MTDHPLDAPRHPGGLDAQGRPAGTQTAPGPGGAHKEGTRMNDPIVEPDWLPEDDVAQRRRKVDGSLRAKGAQLADVMRRTDHNGYLRPAEQAPVDLTEGGAGRP